jgi:hypothetical protein
MTREEFVLKYTDGMSGHKPTPFYRLMLLLEDLAERGCGPLQELDADVAGVALIGAATGFARITITNGATDIVHLPAVADVELGHVVRGSIGATGCEIRVHPDDDDDVAINTVHTSECEAALPTNCSFLARLVSATNWVLLFYAIDGAESAPVPD